MFHLTPIQDFTFPGDNGGPGTLYRRGQAITDPTVVRRILDSEFHIQVTKVSEGALDMPTDDVLFLKDAQAARLDARHLPGTAASGPSGETRDPVKESAAIAPAGRVGELPAADKPVDAPPPKAKPKA